MRSPRGSPAIPPLTEVASLPNSEFRIPNSEFEFRIPPVRVPYGSEVAMRRLVVFFLVLGVALMTRAADRPEGEMFATRSVTYARHGMVGAAHPLAVQIGLDVLKAGGSAVDAAIAVNAALGFLEPVSCGLGGDLFAMVWDPATEKLYGLNASGRAPASLTIDEVPRDRTRNDPRLLALLVDGPGVRRRVVRPSREIRSVADEGPPRPGGSDGARGRAGSAGDRGFVGARRRTLCRLSGIRRSLHARGRGAGRG